MQTARGEMHLALNSSGDEAPLPSGVPHHTLPALFISYARSGQEPGCRAANKMDGTALIRGKEHHKTTKKKCKLLKETVCRMQAYLKTMTPQCQEDFLANI